MIDCVWYIWQVRDLQNRMQVIAGQDNMFGGGTTSLTENTNITNAASKVYQMEKLMSVVDGPFF